MSDTLDRIKANTPALMGARIELKQQGKGYVALCPFHGEKTPSFHLDQREGTWLWKCFGCGKGGDIVTFFELLDNVDTATALARLQNKEWRDEAEKVRQAFKPIESEKPKTTFTVADWERAVKALWASPQALAWLHDIRGLQDDVIKRLRLGYMQKHGYRIKEGMEACRDKGWILFPRIEGEKVLAVKLRSIVEKCFTQINNMDSRSLFNIETINSLEPVYVTEGELDACVLEQAGFRAVSCPSANAEINTESRVKLKLAERIFLAGDNDGVGADYMKKLQRELGENTHLLHWPSGKDANDFFRDECQRNIEEFATRVTALSQKAKEAPPEGFKSVLDRLRETEGTDMGADPNRLHLPKELVDADMMTYTPRGGVALIYSTYSGTGKSMLKTQILTHEAIRGEVVVDLSPEIRDEEYLALLTSQTVGPTRQGGLKRTGKIERAFFHQAAAMLETEAKKRGTNFRYYVGHDVIGQSEEEVLNFLESTIRALGCTRFAIDTFHRLIFAGRGQNQVQAEGSMIKRIEALGNKYGTIFLIIAQSNAEAEGIDNLKRNEHGVLRGSRELRDVPAAIYLLHRNRRPQKNGEDPDDVLELEAGLFAKKTRFKGPAKPQVKLLLKEESSLFVRMDSRVQEPEGPHGQSEQYSDIGEQDEHY